MSRLAALVAALVLAGCGLGFDAGYALWGRGFHKVERRSEPTGESDVERIAEPQNQRPAVRCSERQRPIERHFQVDKHYRYQNGWERSTYAFPLLIDSIVLVAVGLGVHQNCVPARAGEPSSLPTCDGLWALLPFGVDLLYTVLRLVTVKPPKLVGKERRAVLEPRQSGGDPGEAIECPPGLTLVLERGDEQVRAPVGPDGQPPGDFEERARAFVGSGGPARLRVDLGSLSGWSGGAAVMFPPPPPATPPGG